MLAGSSGTACPHQPPSPLVSYATFLVQAAGALLTAAIFSSFHRHSQKSFLLQWTRAWLSLAVFLLGVAVAGQLTGRTTGANVLRFLVTGGTGAAAFLQVGWLLICWGIDGRDWTPP